MKQKIGSLSYWTCLLFGLLTCLSSQTFAGLLLEGGLGIVSFQDTGLAPSWLNPSLMVGVDPISYGNFRLLLGTEYHAVQSAYDGDVRSLGYLAPVARLYFTEHSNIHHGLELGATSVMFAKQPGSVNVSRITPWAGLVQYVAELPFGNFGIALTLSGFVFIESIPPNFPPWFIEGHWCLQYHLGGSAKVK